VASGSRSIVMETWQTSEVNCKEGESFVKKSGWNIEGEKFKETEEKGKGRDGERDKESTKRNRKGAKELV